jgi:hypothetical protein
MHDRQRQPNEASAFPTANCRLTSRLASSQRSVMPLRPQCKETAGRIRRYL